MRAKQRGLSTIAVVLLIILVLLLIGSLPIGLPYSTSGLLVIALIVVLVLALAKKL